MTTATGAARPATPPAAVPARAAAGGRAPAWTRVWTRAWTRAWTFAVLAAAVAWAAALLWARADYVPIWDGRIYAECFARAARELPSAAALRCAGHPSHAYALLVALPQRLAPGSPRLLLATNALLFVAAGVAFARVLRAAFPDSALAADRRLLAAAFAVHPVLLAGVVQPGLDFGVLVFFLCAVAAAVERRPWALAGFGLLLSFSKETGALLYVLLAAMYALTVAVPRPVPRALRTALFGAAVGVFAGVTLVAAWPAGLVAGLALGGAVFLALRPRPLPAAYRPRALARVLAPLAPLALPPLVFGGHLLTRALLPDRGGVLWMGESGGSVVRSLLLPGVRGAAAAYLALLFVLGFLWVPGAVVLADLAVGVRRSLRERPARPVRGDAGALFLLAGLTVGTVYLLTRYVTYANARYLLPAYPLLLVAFGAALLRLRVASGWRRGVLAAVVGLFAASVTRTADPVSRLLWGTFPVGAHRLLRATSLTGECCGWGRDQLAYNLQFTALADLQDAALARVQPVARRRALAASIYGEWYVVGALDARSRRSLRADAAPWPVLVPERPRGGAWPDSVWYLALPNVDNARPLAALARRYAPGRPDTVRARGYAMAVWPLVRLGSGAPVSAPGRAVAGPVAATAPAGRR